MTESFVDRCFSAGKEAGEGVWLDLDILGTESHGAAEAFDFLLLREFGDEGGAAHRVELGGVGVLDAQHIASKLDHGDLEAQTNTQVGQAGFSGVLDDRDLALDAAGAEPAGDNDGIDVLESLGHIAVADIGCVDPVLSDLAAEVSRAVFE